MEALQKLNFFIPGRLSKFTVVRMPYKRSNIPQKRFYATISAEVLCICSATSNYDSFKDSARKLITRLRSQGADTLGIQRVVIELINRHWEPFVKFNLYFRVKHFFP